MFISDPPLVFDLKIIGEKVLFNQFKYESLDGFVKQGDECIVILPPVYRVNPGYQNTVLTTSGNQSLGELVIKANVLPISYEFP
jgi:hypothetical protein